MPFVSGIEIKDTLISTRDLSPRRFSARGTREVSLLSGGKELHRNFDDRHRLISSPSPTVNPLFRLEILSFSPPPLLLLPLSLPPAGNFNWPDDRSICRNRLTKSLLPISIEDRAVVPSLFARAAFPLILLRPPAMEQWRQGFH